MAAVLKMARRAQEQREPPIGRDAYIIQLVDFLFERLLEVVRLRQPEIEANLRGERPLDELPPALLLRALQATGIWFQLLTIAEENAAMRSRRRLEQDGGPTPWWARSATSSATSRPPASSPTSVQDCRPQPDRAVLTAHPTEAKRVTVLGAAPTDLSQADRARTCALDAARARKADRGGPGRDRRAVADRRASARAPDRRQRDRLGPAFLPAKCCSTSCRRLLERLEYALIRHYPETADRCPGLFPLRVLDRRRPGRQSRRHRRDHAPRARRAAARAVIQRFRSGSSSMAKHVSVSRS